MAGPRPVLFQSIGSVRGNRLLAAVMVVGLVSILFSMPRPVVTSANTADPTVPARQAVSEGRSAARSPDQATAGQSVDAVLVYVNETGTPWYSFRGHSPAVPLPVDAPVDWTWFSGNPAAPNLTAPAAPLDSAGFTTQARVAFSREGYAVAVWDSETVYGSRLCGSIETNLTKTDIRFSVFRDTTGTWTAPAVAAAPPANFTEAIYDEAFIGPALAIDNNGNGILAFAYRQTDPCISGAGTRAIRYSLWNGANSTFGADALLETATGSPPFDMEPLAVAFSSHLAAPEATTRQDGIVTWWDSVAPANATCGPGPVSVPLAWPRYARWDGTGFVQVDRIPGERNPADGYFESLDVRNGMAASSDQLGHIAVAFPVSTMTDPCAPAPSHEVWRAIWNATTNTWESGMKVDDGGSPALAYSPDPPGNRARLVYQVPDPSAGGVDPMINRSILDGTGAVKLGQVDAAAGYSPAIAQLAKDTALVVWTDGNRSLRFWERVGGTPPSESTGIIDGAGQSPFLAARTGSPQIPLAVWTYLQYMAHDHIPANMTATVLDRLQTAGSTNLVNLAILLDEGGNPSHTTDFYVKRLDRTALEDHGSLNMGNHTTLQEFIARTVARYPARGEYILSLDDHGNGWRGTCSDNHPTTGDWVDPSELRGALSAVNVTFEVAVFNGCLMGSIETALQVEGFVRTLVASQETMPISNGTQGLRYDQFLGRLVEDPLAAAGDSRAFADSIVTDYEAANLGLRDYTLASIDVEIVSALANDITAFRNLVVDGFNATIRDALQGDRNQAQAMRADPGVRDLFSFFSLARNDGRLPQTVRDKAQAILDWEPLVVSAKWSDSAKPDARGLNIWFEPSRVMYNEAAAAYGATRFAATTAWQDVVRLLAATRGLLFTLESSDPDLFLRVRVLGGLEVGSYSSSETCGGFGNSQVPNAGYTKLGGTTTIFLPMWTTPVDWFIDPMLLTGSASYSLSLQEVTTNATTGDTVVLFTQNLSGNMVPQQPPVTGRFLPDTSAPVTSLQVTGSTGRNQWWRSAVTVTLNVTEGGHGVRSTSYRLDRGNGAPYTTYTGPFQITGEGSHTLEYFSTDLVGNQEPVQTSTIRIDTVPPIVTSTAFCSDPGLAPWCHGPVVVTLTASDATSGLDGIQVALDNNSRFTTYSTPIRVPDDGAHILFYLAEDQAGNLSPPVALFVPIDGTPPTMNVHMEGGQRNAGWFVTSVNVTSRPTDEVSGIASQTIRVGTGPEMPYIAPFVIDTDGIYAIEVVAIDAAGNQAREVTLVKIDKTPPSFSLVLPGGAGRPVTSSSLEIQLTAVTDETSGLAGCSVALDGGRSVPLGPEGVYRLTGLEDGPHTLASSCSDNAGNVGSKSADFTVNTNLLSPEGPYGPIPLSGLAGAIVAAAGVGVYVAWRRRRRSLFALAHRRPIRTPPPPKGGKRGF